MTSIWGQVGIRDSIFAKKSWPTTVFENLRSSFSSPPRLTISTNLFQKMRLSWFWDFQKLLKLMEQLPIQLQKNWNLLLGLCSSNYFSEKKVGQLFFSSYRACKLKFCPNQKLLILAKKWVFMNILDGCWFIFWN